MPDKAADVTEALRDLPRRIPPARGWLRTAHPWICPLPACRRMIMLRYNPRRPLPCCTGNPTHAPMMLVSSIEDEYRDCFDRFAHGDRMLKPTINNRNAHLFPKLPTPYNLRDIADARVRG